MVDGPERNALMSGRFPDEGSLVDPDLKFEVLLQGHDIL